MKTCTTCGQLREMWHGRKCRECRLKAVKKTNDGKRGKFCPVCQNKHAKISKECSMKCKLLNRCDKTKGCWIWQKGLNESGYGKIQENFNGKKRHLIAHRESYQVFRGKIPEGSLVLHKCDNPACINPDHLFLGDHRDNVLDMIRKGRGGKQKLKIEDVHVIRHMFKEGMGNKKIAEIYGVARCTISSIRIGLTWKHTNVNP